MHAGLAALAREHGVTMFMVVHAALAVLLGKLGAGTDVPVGTVVAGRTDQAAEALVGFFVNTLVLRVTLDGDPAVMVTRGSAGCWAGRGRPGWARSRTRTCRSRSWSTCWPRSGRWPATRCSRSCWRCRTPPRRCWSCPACTPARLPAGTGTAKFDLDLSLAEVPARGGAPAGLRGALTAAADLFDPATAAMIAARFTMVLRAVVADPQVRLSRLDLLGPAGRAQVLDGLE